MIIYIDKEGRENIIRSDELIEKLITENIITENTLLKTEVAGDWIVASEFELFKKHNKIIEKIDDTDELIKQMEKDYNESLKDPVKINLFKDKWKVVPVIISDEDNTKLKKSDAKFSTSNIWLVKINTTIIILIGRNVHSNLAAFLADNNRGIKENLSGLFETQNSSELNVIKNPIVENKGNQITIITKGILGLPNFNASVDLFPKYNKIESKQKKTKEKEKDIDKIIEDKFYVPKTSAVPKSGNTKINNQNNNEIKKTETTKSNNSETKTTKSYKKMGLIEATKVCFSKYFDFTSRARRAEYWYFALFLLIFGVILDVFDAIILGVSYSFYNELGILGGLFSLITFIPGISVSVRRLHDINRSGWWLLLFLVIIIGWIVLLIWFCKDSDKEKNRFGNNPKF